ncbi:MAG: hypothetical protein EA360_04785 [Balneolaceae bacterium]|nr:MAG: hypothetical protein EA360_04785 [Balneolaceae bacterium]
MNILITERINASNQYIELLASAYQTQGHQVIFDVQNFLFSDFLPDFIHIHWPEALYKWRHQLKQNQDSTDLIRSRLNYFKTHHVPIAYTAHNLLPHKDVSDFDRDIYKIVIEAADILIHHGEKSIGLLKDSFDCAINKKHIICPHGPYPFVEVDHEDAKSLFKLPADKLIFLNFGRQRQSKGPDFIQHVFHSLSDGNAFLFTIGPNPPANRTEKAIRLFKQNLQGKFPSLFRKSDEFRDVNHNEIPAIFAASDAVFLGHRSGLNSGLIAHAISYKKPVVYPNLGNFREQTEGWPWAVEYEAGDADSATSAISELITKMKTSPLPQNRDNSIWLERNSWDHYVSTVIREVQTHLSN